MTMKTYHILISEGQRERITRALQLLDKVEGGPPVDSNDSLESANLAYLTTLFLALPHDEAESPGVIHGLCL